MESVLSAEKFSLLLASFCKVVNKHLQVRVISSIFAKT